MDEEYMRCIQAFASMEVSGQAAGGGTQTPIPSLLDMLGSAGSSYGNADMITQMLGTFLGGDVSSIAGLAMDNIDFLSGRALDTQQTAEYIARNSFDAGALEWTRAGGQKVISLPEANEGKTEKDEEQQTDADAVVEYAFMLNGETVRVQSHTPTSRAVGETEKMYYDTFSGALFHPRVLGSMLLAAAAFAAAGVAMILFQHTLLP
jgi:hypothetical protein